MKDCIFITKEFPYFSGETFIENEIDFLCKNFDNVYLYVLNATKNDNITRTVPDNVTIIPLSGVKSKFKYLHYLIRGIKRPEKCLKLKFNGVKKILIQLYCRGRAASIARKILKDILKENIAKKDLVIYSYWFDYQAIAAWMIGEKLKKNGCRAVCVSRAHGYDLYWYRNSVGYLPFQKESIIHLDGVFPCSDDGTEYLRKKYPDFSSKIKTARLGTVDHGINVGSVSGEIVFLTCCSMKPLKRMPLFAKAFAMLKNKGHYNCKWVCIGDGEDMGMVKQIVHENNMGEYVDFLGALRNEKVIDYYMHNKISYFCNVSTVEGLPVSVMEAMSFGIPVIATDVGGTKELVDESVGRLMPSNITEFELYSEISKELDISDEEHSIKRNFSRKKWEEKVSAKKNYNEWVSTINNL